jgi:hypothetical protein
VANRVFLHIGPPKTGTTYLQSVLWANKEALQREGLLLPLARLRDHYLLASIARNDRARLARMPERGLTAWDRMRAAVATWPNDVLISHELFAPTSGPRARWVLEQFHGVAREVHLIVTARDLARQIPATWQQTVRQGGTTRLREYCGLVKAEDPSIEFWKSQDLPRQLRKWRNSGVAPGHIHMVTIPASRSEQDSLWARFASAVSIAPGAVDLDVARPNQSLGAVETEMLRRVNELAPIGEGRPLRQNMVRVVLAQGILAERPGAQRFGVPPQEHPWVMERGNAMVDKLRTMEFDLVGDLAELVPSEAPVVGPVPDDVSDADIGPMAIETISALLYRSHEHETALLKAEIERLSAKVERQRQALDRRAGRIHRRHWPRPRAVLRRLARRLGLV